MRRLPVAALSTEHREDVGRLALLELPMGGRNLPQHQLVAGADFKAGSAGALQPVRRLCLAPDLLGHRAELHRPPQGGRDDRPSGLPLCQVSALHTPTQLKQRAVARPLGQHAPQHALSGRQEAHQRARNGVHRVLRARLPEVVQHRPGDRCVDLRRAHCRDEFAQGACQRMAMLGSQPQDLGRGLGLESRTRGGGEVTRVEHRIPGLPFPVQHAALEQRTAACFCGGRVVQAEPGFAQVCQRLGDQLARVDRGFPGGVAVVPGDRLGIAEPAVEQGQGRVASVRECLRHPDVFDGPVACRRQPCVVRVVSVAAEEDRAHACGDQAPPVAGDGVAGLIAQHLVDQLGRCHQDSVGDSQRAPVQLPHRGPDRRTVEAGHCLGVFERGLPCRGARDGASIGFLASQAIDQLLATVDRPGQRRSRAGRLRDLGQACLRRARGCEGVETPLQADQWLGLGTQIIAAIERHVDCVCTVQKAEVALATCLGHAEEGTGGAGVAA